MKRISAAVVVLVAGLLGRAIYAAEPLASKEVLAEGKQLFAEKKCSTCHTAGGLGEAGKIDLDKYRMYADALLFGSVMWNHAPIMAAKPQLIDDWPRFAPGELPKLVAYIHDASGSSQHQYLMSDDASAGEQIFAKKCRQCHSVQSHGGPLAPDLSARLAKTTSRADIGAAMWNHIPQMVRVSKEAGIHLPTLDPKEMADLFSYLLSTLTADEQRALAAPTPVPGGK